MMDLEEFKVLLEKMKIRMAPPKALKYFRMCDDNGSGANWRFQVIA